MFALTHITRSLGRVFAIATVIALSSLLAAHAQEQTPAAAEQTRTADAPTLSAVTPTATAVTLASTAAAPASTAVASTSTAAAPPPAAAAPAATAAAPPPAAAAPTPATGPQTPAAAEQAPAAGEQVLQTVVVTGSLIRRPAAETTEAITILTQDNLRSQGVTNVEQALNTLTQNSPTINISSSVGTFSGGGTYANLRNLGQQRTLVLLDGQRMAPNAFNGNAVDLSGVPFSAIDSVQVLREGASSLYGTDAIAGVINFITKKNYQGFDVGATFNRPQENGGASGQADITFGHGDLVNDGWNLLITGSYSKQQELRATQRGFSAEGFDPVRGLFNTNNPGSWPGSVIDSNGNFWQTGFPGCTGNPVLTTYFGNCAYRYSAATDLLPQNEQYSGMVEITKALPGNNQVQLQYFYTYATVTAWSGPMFYEFPMNTASPYFPTAASLAGAPCWQGPSCAPGFGPNLTGTTFVPSSTNTGPCNPTTGPASSTCVANASPVSAVWTDPKNDRYTGNINREQRIMLTFSGSNAGWDYTGILNWSQNKNDNRNISGFPNEFTQGVPGTPALTDANGVLLPQINPFGPQSAAGQAAINDSYISGVYQEGEDTRWSVDGTASHELGNVLVAKRAATVAFGATVAGEHFQNATTPYNDIVQAATGLSASNTRGSRQQQAMFFELDAPITDAFDVNLSDRWDRYSDFGTTQNGKIALRYQPASWVTFRGTASTGFRAPTLFELNNPNSIAASTSGTMGQGNPYCTPATYKPPLWTAATCNTQGLGVFGGNTKLTPETSDNFNVGIVLQPVQDMGITLDYYNIQLKNTISTVPASAIYANPTGLSQYIVTNNQGTLTPSIASALDCTPYTQPTCGYVQQFLQNTGRINTDGIDLSIQYQQRTPLGTFREDLEGTSVLKFQDQQFSGGPFVNLVGCFCTLPPSYRWQHLLRIDWTSPQEMFGAGLINRLYSNYIDEFPDGAGNQRTVGGYSTVDAYGSWKPIHSVSLLFGIKNITNHQPPFTNMATGNFAAGYNPLVVDPNLRTFYVNVRYDVSTK